MTSVDRSRPVSLGDNGQIPMAGNGIHSFPPGQGGRPNGAARPGGNPMPHIDDVLAVPMDVDPNQSLKKLLDTAEMSLRQAEMSRDFNRPALALKEYIRASIIAIQTIQSHREFVSLKSQHPDLLRTYTALLKRIQQQDDVFRKIKEDIIADNKRTGVQAKSKLNRQSHEIGGGSRPMSPSTHSVTGSIDGSPRSSMSPRSSISSPPRKFKPAVQPKPQSLHGNAIKPGLGGMAANAGQDLVNRFANLRGPQPSPGQDPRIKTHSFPIPKPSGPREMPPPPTTPNLSLDSSMPSLPKLPDAIYSPARGSISADTPRPPSCPPTKAFSRTNSIVSMPGTPSATNQTQSDYFAPTQSYSNNSMPPVPPGNPLRIPEGSTISPEELFQAMKCKGTILIIDIRLREDFNEGHIMSSSTICIEPNILLRENVSADEICDSLVLGPTQEQTLFDQRQNFDLVVLYDQDTEIIPSSPRNSDDLAILSLHQALTSFNYGKELKNPPKLLKGGIDAWTDLMGPASLQTAALAASRPPQTHQLGRRTYAHQRSRSKYEVKPLKPDDVKAWQETLKKNDDVEASPNFLRTTEDFLRRFPPVSTDQQSMTSPTRNDYKSAYGISHKVDLYTDLPSPPTRPAPALPRPSYSKLSQSTDGNDVYDHANASQSHKTVAARVQQKAFEQQPAGDHRPVLTGLNNPGNWCYANSTLQSLLASPGFGRELSQSEWMTKYKAPRKGDEKIDHPQLMIRIISNLFHWMTTSNFQAMKAQTLMDYSRHLVKQSRGSEEFGGSKQQDAQEFMSFVLTHLHDETNSRRDRKGQVAQPDTKQQTLLRAAAEFWRNHLEYNQSIIDRYWRGIDLSTVECSECHTSTYSFTPFEWIPVTVNMGRSKTLEDVLSQHTAKNTLDDFSCDHCKRPTRAQQYLSFARLPSLLCVAFRRFDYQHADARKSTAPITWDFNDCDFSRYFLPPKDCEDAPEVTDPAFRGPFHYECYAVIIHGGSRIDNGHYYAYVRDSASRDPYAWYLCNDARVTKVRIGSGDKDDVQEEVFKSGRDRVPYIVFFRRKDVR